MNKSIRSAVVALIVPLLMCVVAGCSSSYGEADVLDYVGGDAVLAFTADANAVIENLDCNANAGGINLSEDLERLVSLMTKGDRKQLKELLSCPGIDYKNISVGVYEDESMCLAIGLTDPKAFVSYAKNTLGADLIEDEDRILLFADNHYSGFVSGNVAIVLSMHDVSHIDVRSLDNWLAKRAETPLSKTQRDALESRDFLNGFYDVKRGLKLSQELGATFSPNVEVLALSYGRVSLANSLMVFKTSLEGVKCTTQMKFVDAEGNRMSPLLDCGHVDTSMLRYACSDDLAVIMGALPADFDWKKLGDHLGDEYVDGSSMDIMMDVLGNLDGTFVIAAGPTNIMSVDRVAGWHIILAAQMKPGVAAQYVANVNQMIAANRNELAGMGAVVSVEADGDTFVANIGRPRTRGACLIPPSRFKEACFGLVISIPKDNLLSSLINFPFGVELSALAYGENGEIILQETETDGLLLDNIVKFAAKMLR